jgi:hypothetical protein
MCKNMAEHDRRRYARLARRGLIPAGSVAGFVWLAAAAREVRAVCGSDAMVLEGLVEACNRAAVESWLKGRYSKPA